MFTSLSDNVNGEKVLYELKEQTSIPVTVRLKAFANSILAAQSTF